MKTKAVAIPATFQSQSQASTQAGTTSAVLGIALMALIGAATVFVAGHAQSAALHDAAHDTRHATGFPCH